MLGVWEIVLGFGEARELSCSGCRVELGEVRELSCSGCRVELCWVVGLGRRVSRG